MGYTKSVTSAKIVNTCNNPTLKLLPLPFEIYRKHSHFFYVFFLLFVPNFLMDGYFLHFSVFSYPLLTRNAPSGSQYSCEKHLCVTRGVTRGWNRCGVKNINNATSQAQAALASLVCTIQHSTGMDRSRSNMFECDNKSLCFVKWILFLSNILVWVS